jgi:CubicO group peptidase (beta-lactamase class C family)
MTSLQGLLETAVAGGAVPGAAALVARGDAVAERLFEPLGMVDTGFHVPPDKLDRLPPYHGADLAPIDVGLWTAPRSSRRAPGASSRRWPTGYRFGQMLLARGGGLLSAESVRLMTTDHLTKEQRDASRLFLEGAGWGFGGAVEADGRYGWVGGTGTTAHLAPATGTIGVLLTQVQMAGPTPTPIMREFWAYAFGL